MVQIRRVSKQTINQMDELMSLKKYIKKADKLELATYKLALICQIQDTQKTIELIDKQLQKPTNKVNNV